MNLWSRTRGLAFKTRCRFIVDFILFAWEHDHLWPTKSDHAAYLEECKAKLRAHKE